MDFKQNKEHWFIIARWAYSLGKEHGICTDAQYSILERYIKNNNLLPEYTARTWSEDPCPVELLKQYGMEELIESIVVRQDSASIQSITTRREIEFEYSTMNKPHRMSIKHDGFNMKLIYINGKFYLMHSRGRSGNKLDFKEINIPSIPDTIDIKDETATVFGEVTLSDDNFKILKSMYPDLKLKSSRSSVRTALAHPEAQHLLNFHAFNVDCISDIHEEEAFLDRNGFERPAGLWINSYQELLEGIDKLSIIAKDSGIPSDGVVVEDELKEKQRAIRVGYWEESIYKSYVIGYSEEAGEFQDIPKILIKPIDLGKSTHSIIPITNWKRIINLRLTIGSPIAFTLTSKAAPVIDEEMTKLLQEEYFGRYVTFKELIDMEEEMKYI